MGKKRRTILEHDIAWRYKSAHRGEKGDRVVSLYRRHLNGKQNHKCAEAEAIFNNNSLRIRLEAIILTGLEFNKIAEIIGISEDILCLYSKLFFDIEPIKHILFKKTQIAESCEIEEERFLKLLACKKDGLDLVLYFCGIETEIEPIKIMNTLSKDMLLKALYFNTSITKENIKTNLDILRYSSKIFKEESNETDALTRVIERLNEKFFDEE